jgi:glycosyltransferase involved in cell wall biosynthesis
VGKGLKILMFGWELPPFNSGGLGVACYGLSKALSKQSEVLFVLPYKVDVDTDFLKLIFANENFRIETIKSLLAPYMSPESYGVLKKDYLKFGGSLFDEVKRYAEKARKIAEKEEFDVIHAHDWLSFQAGIVAKEVAGKPLIVQVHATEYDRCGGHNMNKNVFEIEKMGMEKADKVIAVSNFTKKIIEEQYGISPSKISVVHNSINADEYKNEDTDDRIFQIKKNGKKIVLFAGRITLQKGPEYFLNVAKKVLMYDKNVLFVMAGSGDMKNKVIQSAAVMGISDKVLFTGFLRGSELSNVYKMADIFVMPSVSEPFGIAALESMLHGTPIIVSKQSGVSEVVKNAMKVDFWDIDEMANKILSTFKHSSLKKTLEDNGQREIGEFSWDFAASECMKLYSELLTK